MGAAPQMASKWRFSRRIVLPVVLAFGLTVAAVGGFAYWSTTRSDERALERQTHLIARAIEQETKTLATGQTYYSDWDEAITALRGSDLQWLDDNLASSLYSGNHFDRIYVVGPQGRAIYAMYGGGKTSASRFEDDRATVAPFIDKLKAIDAAGALAAYDSGNSDKVPFVGDLAAIDGRPAVLGISAIMSESGDDDLKIVPGTENFLVTVRFLDAGFGKELADQYLIEDPLFAAAPAPRDAASYPLMDRAGNVVGWLSWQPDRPGAQILRETLPAMLAAFAIAALIILLLVRSLHRTTAALEAGRAEAEYNANHDPLTGLANRTFFARRLEDALNGRPADDTLVALLALDLDRFKQVNDTLGHEAGDQLLREVGQRLTPLVGADDTVARLGGDEFAIIRLGVRQAEEIAALSSTIISALGAPFVLAGQVAQIGVSIGAVLAPASRAMRDLSSKADIALYEAKASGRNTFRLFDEAMLRSAQYRERVTGEMEQAGLPIKPGKVA